MTHKGSWEISVVSSDMLMRQFPVWLLLCARIHTFPLVRDDIIIGECELFERMAQLLPV